MQAIRGLTENITSGFDVLFTKTMPSDILLSLQQEYHSFTAPLWPPNPYIVALSVFTSGMLFYYYMWLPINWVLDLTDVGYHHIKGSPQRRTTKKELVAEVRRRMQRGDLPPVYPNGWFALLESGDIKDGQVKHVQALGENFAVMRSSKGAVYILDAYCPHVGANMAVGGVVRGDCLECPYSVERTAGDSVERTAFALTFLTLTQTVWVVVPKAAAVKKWLSHEVNGFVFVWYHAEGEPPSWQVQSVPEIENGQLWYRGRSELYINAHIQDLVENVADVHHFEAIHRISAFAGADLCTYNRFIHSFLKHAWTVDWRQHSTPGESHMGTMSVTHSIRLFNKFTLIPRDTATTQTGPGCTIVHNDNFRTVFTTTPVEPLMTKMVYRVYCPPHIYVFAGLFFYTQAIMLERDVMVWNHKKYMMKPTFVKEDESLTRHRRWFSQFYTANSPRFSFQHTSVEW